jgi:hypothetical protein
MSILSLRTAVLFLLAGLAACSGGGASVANGPNGQLASSGVAGNSIQAVSPDSVAAPLASSIAGGGGVAAPSVAASSVAPPSVAASSVEPPSVAASSTVSAALTSATGTVLAVDAGGGSSTGNWIADEGYNGGAVSTVSNSIDTSRASNPAPASIYQSQRYGGSLTYALRLLTPNAAYTTRLHFAETFVHASGQRVFDVQINGTQVLSGFDTYASAGGANIAVVKQFASTADSSGTITIKLSATTNYASIAGIEFTSGATVGGSGPSPTPIPPSSGGWTNIFPGWAGNHPVGSNPVLAPQSQQMIDTLYADSDIFNGPGLTDDSESYWTARSSDPLHTIHCTNHWGPSGGPCLLEGKQIHVPNGAVPAANSDHHTSILQPDGCTVDEMWHAQDMSRSTITAAFAAIQNQCTENGFNTHGGAGTTAGGASNRIGHSPLAELQTGVIHHALIVLAGCDLSSGYVGQALYPGQYQACNPGVSGVGIPMGAYLWSDVAPGSLPSGLDKATRMICVALNTYGALMDDTNGNWYGIKLGAFWAGNGRSGEYPNGVATNDNPSGYTAWFNANAGPYGSTNPTACFPGGDWRHHMHVLRW